VVAWLGEGDGERGRRAGGSAGSGAAAIGGGQLFVSGLPRGCRDCANIEQQLRERFSPWGECRGEGPERLMEGQKHGPKG
jgi:hypothetical protein